MANASDVNMEVAHNSNTLLGLYICKCDAGVGFRVVVVANTLQELIRDEVNGGPSIKEDLSLITFNFAVMRGAPPPVFVRSLCSVVAL